MLGSISATQSASGERGRSAINRELVDAGHSDARHVATGAGLLVKCASAVSYFYRQAAEKMQENNYCDFGFLELRGSLGASEFKEKAPSFCGNLSYPRSSMKML